jgi:hypothetical protein
VASTTATLTFATGVAAALLSTGIARAPLAQADGNASNLDQLVAQVYNQVQRGCTPHTPPQFQRINWDNGGPTGQGGSGRIVDANPSLGGPFTAYWNIGPTAPAGARVVPALGNNGYWDITLEFC